VVSSVLFLSVREMGTEGADERPPLTAVLLLSLAGMTAMGSLVLLARRFPALWGARQEPPTLTVPAPSLPRLVLPWVVGATLSLGGLVGVDARGIRLSWIDMQQRLPKLPKDAPDALQAERAHLMHLREEARSGRAPIEAYEEERTRQIQAHAPEKQ
jgi:uncharacterized protein